MDFKTIVDTMFQNKKNWQDISNDEKESLFFIVNRFLAKKHPKQSQYFNDKSLDKATCMDIWFNFLKSEVRVPYWFWKGPTKKKDPSIKDWQVLRDFYQMNIKDIYMLVEMFPDDVKMEIKRISLINKELEK